MSDCHCHVPNWPRAASVAGVFELEAPSPPCQRFSRAQIAVLNIFSASSCCPGRLPRGCWRLRLVSQVLGHSSPYPLLLTSLAVAQHALAQVGVPIVDPETGIQLSTWSGQGVTLGMALPANAATTDVNDIIGLLVRTDSEHFFGNRLTTGLLGMPHHLEWSMVRSLLQW
jgi:hypothetical protein